MNGGTTQRNASMSGIRITKSKQDLVKRDSWDMAKQLIQSQRISLEMAVWALKQSGHSREEVKRFIEEVREAINENR